MLQYYFDGDYTGLTIDECFSFPEANKLIDLKHALSTGDAWTGRATPYRNKHGISSVELMMQRDVENLDEVWLYTMEHPAIKGVLRFSSRSEIQILQVLLDNTLEYVFLRDPDGRFIIINQAFRDAVAVYPGNSPIGETIDSFVSPKSAEWIRGIDAAVYKTGQPSVNQVSEFVFNHGTEQWLQLTTVPVRGSEGQLVGSVSVARDISDLKRTESELLTAIESANAASRAKGEFLAAMSHEIRTPINGIIGASELCQETRLDLEQREYLATVIQCSDTLLSLVNDVLDFSKIEAGQLNLEKLNFCPAALLDDIADEFAQMVRKKGLELIVASDESLPRYVMGDPTRVKQILYNLIGNAIKFTHTGEVVVRAELMERSEKKAQIRFVVVDSGIGIAPQRREAIFNSFTQADMSTTRKYGGTGLGLSICKELVGLMEGSIEVQSELGEGATFIVELPFELAEHFGADALPFNPELAGLRVLVVDDNETNRSIYKQMCANWGYYCDTASDAMEALVMLEEALTKGEPYQLVLLDQHMPGLTGLDFAGLLKNRPNLKEIRIILLSSSLDRQEMRRAEILGVARALSKPVKRATLLEVILETFEVGPNGRFGLPERSAPSAAREPEVEISLNILLAEDNEVNQGIAVRRLERLGHRVTVATDGTKVLRLLQEHYFDCILMDIQMPEMDGYEATRRIRQIELETGQPPIYIIAMTAHAMKGDRERCIQAGMDNYISKPFRVEQLKEVLADASRFKSVPLTLKNEHTTAPAAVESAPAGASFLDQVNAMSVEDQEDLMEVSEIFLETAPLELKNLQSAAAQGDYDAVVSSAHALKGIVGIFKSDRCVDLAGRLEQSAEQANAEEVQDLLHGFSVELGRLLKEVEAWVQQAEG